MLLCQELLLHCNIYEFGALIGQLKAGALSSGLPVAKVKSMTGRTI
jgi:hypothetical protein